MSYIELDNEEFEKRLMDAFPKLYADMGGSEMVTCMAYGVSVGNGWHDLIWELSEKLEPLIGDTDCRAAQVKEKFGGLRFYMTSYTDTMHDIIHEYEEKSYITCEVCGEPGTTRRGGWIKTLCDEHAKK